MTYIVVLGLVVVVILVVVLVALGMRASRAGQDDDDWMADEQEPQQQPRGRRAAAVEEEISDGYGTGYDRRVAGAPLGAPTATPLAAPVSAPQAPSQAVAQRRGRANDEMADDDYWATITFDKPKFPWQNADAHQPVTGEDPLGVPAEDHQPSAQEQQPASASSGLSSPQPYGQETYGQESYGQETYAQEPYSPEPYGKDPYSTQETYTPQETYSPEPYSPDPQPVSGFGADPLDAPLPPLHSPAQSSRPDPYDLPLPTQSKSSTGPMRMPDPLSAPMARADSLDSTQAYSYGDGLSSSYGDSLSGGLPSTPAPAPLPPPVPAPALPPPVSGSAPATGGGSGDTDGHRLPTVDELLQRIQTDRRRATPASNEPQSPYGAAPVDPLNDPLTTSSDSGYGNSSSWAGSASTGSYDPDPLSAPSGGLPSGGQLSGSGQTGGAGASGGYDTGGYRSSSSSSSGYSTDGYPSTPAYEPPRYDDPLAGYGESSNGRESYGSYGQNESTSTSPRGNQLPGETSRYRDFSGSKHSGATPSDPLTGSRGYGDSPAPSGSGYGSGYGTSDPAYGSAPQSPDYSDPNTSNPYGTTRDPKRPPEEWDSTYRDYRR